MKEPDMVFRCNKCSHLIFVAKGAVLTGDKIAKNFIAKQMLALLQALTLEDKVGSGNSDTAIALTEGYNLARADLEAKKKELKKQLGLD